MHHWLNIIIQTESLRKQKSSRRKKEKEQINDIQLFSSLERPSFLLPTFVLCVVFKFKKLVVQMTYRDRGSQMANLKGTTPINHGVKLESGAVVRDLSAAVFF